MTSYQAVPASVLGDGRAQLVALDARLAELAKLDEEREALELLLSRDVLGRPFVAPPDTPADRVKALQDAFMAMCRDKSVRDEAEKLGIDTSSIDAEEVLRLVGRMVATPRDVVARYNSISAER